jgi:hypothetical protein
MAATPLDLPPRRRSQLCDIKPDERYPPSICHFGDPSSYRTRRGRSRAAPWPDRALNAFTRKNVVAAADGSYEAEAAITQIFRDSTERHAFLCCAGAVAAGCRTSALP